MTSQPGKQTIAIHILPNISRSKSNQTTKFSQSIEYHTRIIFLEKSYTKCKSQNGAYLWINILKFYTVYFCCMPSSVRSLDKDIETKLVLPHIRLF